jgi:hypothetical protein
MKGLLICTILLAALMPPLPAVAEDFVQRFLGVWVGKGLVRPSGFGAPEKVRCKVKGTLMTPNQVSFAGRCATTSGATAFQLLVAQDETGLLFAAKIRLSAVMTEVDFKGRNEGGQIELLQVEPIEQKERLLTSKVTLSFPQVANIKMTDDITDLNSGQSAQSLEILFVRQD